MLEPVLRPLLTRQHVALSQPRNHQVLRERDRRQGRRGQVLRHHHRYAAGNRSPQDLPLRALQVRGVAAVRGAAAARQWGVPPCVRLPSCGIMQLHVLSY